MAVYNREKPYNSLPDLPPVKSLESTQILKAAIAANRVLAELKGYCQTLPDPHLLLNTIILQESKDSSAIENIVTTQDELYKASISINDKVNHSAAKEVLLYREAIYSGMDEMKKKGIITVNLLVSIMQKLKNTTAGIRNTQGVKLVNPSSKEMIYTPPEGEDIIQQKLRQLEIFINDEDVSDLDPLIKMALIHYQFEAIHPFADENGRTGRILNVLYLVNKNLISLPVLYLSYFIIHNKAKYYLLLREVTEKNNWDQWVLYMLHAVTETAKITLNKIDAIQKLKLKSEGIMRDALKSSYTRDFADLLFSYPYVKIKILEEKGIAKRQTASVYLQTLAEKGLLNPIKVGKEMYYVNHGLMKILSE